MGEAFITRRGGGSLQSFAFIVVKFPENSICSCKKGDISANQFLFSETHCLFYIPSAGTWTVTITNGILTTMKDVVISAEGQSENIVMFYETNLYFSGDECTDITGGWESKTNNATADKQEERLRIGVSGSQSISRGGAWYTSEPINLNGFNTLSCLATHSGTNVGAYFGISPGKTAANPDYIIRTEITGGTQEAFTLDISNYNDSYYVYFNAWGTAVQVNYNYMYRMILKP